MMDLLQVSTKVPLAQVTNGKYTAEPLLTEELFKACLHDEQKKIRFVNLLEDQIEPKEDQMTLTVFVTVAFAAWLK